MPSASVKLEHQGSQETLDPFSKVMNLVEKKIRNLEKRKNKLEQYQQDLREGKTLNEDQQQAVANFDAVQANLELVRDLSTQFATIQAEFNKTQKKQSKREQLEKQQEEINRIKEILKIQDVLHELGQEDVRLDYLAGTNGAVQMTAENLESLDTLYKLVSPTRAAGQSIPEFEDEYKTAAEHLAMLMEGRNKEAAGTTFKALHNLVQSITSCSYPEKKPVAAAPEQVVEEEEEEPPTTTAPDAAAAALKEDSSEYTNGVLAEEPEEIAPVVDVVASPAPEGPPPGLATPAVPAVLPSTVPPEPAAPVTHTPDALVAAMAQISSTGVQGGAQVAPPMPPPPSYFTQAPPQQPAPQQATSPQQPPQPQPTPLQSLPPPTLQSISISDLVAPGNFDFLQESQVAQEPPNVYMDPAVVSIGSIKTDPIPQRTVSPAPQPPPVPSMVAPSQDPTHPSNIPTQTYTNQNFNNVVSYPVYSSNSVVDSTPNPPPPIPLPPQTRLQEKMEFNPEASPWPGQQVTSQAPPTISTMQQQPPQPQPPQPPQQSPQQQQPSTQQQPPPPPQDDSWGEVPVNGGDDKWGPVEVNTWDEYDDGQGSNGAVASANGHGDYDRRGGHRGRGRGTGGYGPRGSGGFRGGRGGNYPNNRGNYGGYGGGFRGGRGGMGPPRGNRGGFRGQGPRGNFRGRGGNGYQGQRPAYQQQPPQQ